MHYYYSILKVGISVSFYFPFFQNYEPEPQIEIPTFLHQRISLFVLWNKKAGISWSTSPVIGNSLSIHVL